MACESVSSSDAVDTAGEEESVYIMMGAAVCHASKGGGCVALLRQRPAASPALRRDDSSSIHDFWTQTADGTAESKCVTAPWPSATGVCAQAEAAAEAAAAASSSSSMESSALMAPWGRPNQRRAGRAGRGGHECAR
jgi:hypothetical protein